MEDRFYDNTRISDYRTCPRYFYYRHVRGWVPDKIALALTFGLAWHDAMDVLWTVIARECQNITPSEAAELAYLAFLERWKEQELKDPTEMTPEEALEIMPRHPSVAREMLHEYAVQRFPLISGKEFDLIDCEKPFAVPMDPKDDTLFYVGRLDKIFSIKSKIHIGDHKTTSLYKKDGGFRRDFVESFSPNSQVDGYTFASGVLYENKQRTIWVDAALVHKTVHDQFRFIEIDRTMSQLYQWVWETREWINRIEEEKKNLAENKDQYKNTEYLAGFPKNTGSCWNYGGCPYIPLCKAYANPEAVDETPAGYKEEHWSPFDILKLAQLGFEDDKAGDDK